jgi:hypothetical protein
VVTTAALLEAAVERGIEVLEHPNGIFRVALAQLPETILLVQEFNLVVLGLDGLLLDGAVIVPLIDFIADFSAIAGSWEHRVRDSASQASEVVTVWGVGPTHVELTLDGLED